MPPGPVAQTDIRKTIERTLKEMLEQREQLDENITRMTQSLMALSGQNDLETSPVLKMLQNHTTTLAAGTDGTRPRNSVGPDKVAVVRDYLAEQPGRRARQADIGAATGLNTGTVSVALRVMQEQQEVEALGKHDRSMMWRLRRAPRA